MSGIDKYKYYECDGITIYHGDCREVLPYLPKVDFIYADPPYGVGKADWDGAYLTGWELEALAKSERGMVVNCGTKALPIIIPALGEHFKDLFYAWNKNGMTRTPIGFMNVIMAVVAGKVEMGQNFCQFVIRDLTRKNHPSPKPIEYMECIVQRFSKPQQTILDPFMGSGTTLVAAKQLHRKAIGIEIEKRYCDIAIKRLSQGVLDLSTESNSRGASSHEKPSPSSDDRNHTGQLDLLDNEHRRDVENI
jgi:DNA modification methylase